MDLSSKTPTFESISALGGCGGLGQLWEALAELWEALGELWLPINRKAAVLLIHESQIPDHNKGIGCSFHLLFSSFTR